MGANIIDVGKNVGKCELQKLKEQIYNDLFGILPMGGTIQQIAYSLISLRDQFLLEKFKMFLEGVNNDQLEQMKISEFFVEQEERREYFQIILKTLDDIETDEKIRYLINLTRALLHEFISKDDYFRLVNCIRVLLVQDLRFLKGKIDVNYLSNNPNVDALLQVGLMYQSEFAGPTPGATNKYKFTQLAIYLDKFGISFEDEKYSYTRKIEELSETSHQAMINTLGFRYADE